MSSIEERLIDHLHQRFSSNDGPASDATVQAGDDVWPSSDIPDAIHIEGFVELGQLAREVLLFIDPEPAK